MFILSMTAISAYLLFYLKFKNFEVERCKNEVLTVANDFGGSKNAPPWLHRVILNFEIEARSYLPFLMEMSEYLDRMMRQNRRAYFEIMSRMVNVGIIYLIMFTLGYSENRWSSLVIFIYFGSAIKICKFKGKQEICKQILNFSRSIDTNFRILEEESQLAATNHRAVIGILGTMAEIGVFAIGIWHSRVLL
jgi:hypothetical protein